MGPELCSGAVSVLKISIITKIQNFSLIEHLIPTEGGAGYLQK